MTLNPIPQETERALAPIAEVTKHAVPLYERTNALATVEAWLEEHEGELTPELEALLNEALGDFNEKAERVAAKIKEFEVAAVIADGAAKAIQGEADRLKARAKARANDAARLKAYLQRELERAKLTKAGGDKFTVALQRNAKPTVTFIGSLEALQEAAPSFVNVVPAQLSLDKGAIEAAAKAGEPLPDGLTVEDTYHVRIR